MSARVVKRGSGPSELPMQFHAEHSHPPAPARPQKLVYVLLFICGVLLMTVFALLTRGPPQAASLGSAQAVAHIADLSSNLSPPEQTGNIFVSYSYFEKDDVQVRICLYMQLELECLEKTRAHSGSHT